MPVKIQNLSNRPVLLRLNSGQTLHIDPRKTSGEVMNVEVERNTKVDKLVARRIIALHKVDAKARAPAGSKKKKAEPTEEKK